MTNDDIIEKLSLTGSLMEINDENSFKSGAYKSAAFNLEKLGHDFFSMTDEQISKLDGVGKSIAQAIIQMKGTGTFEEFERLTNIIPEGVVDLLSVNGIGPKKIRTLWKDMNITSKKDLMNACKNGLIAAQKGFGEKTQKAIEESLLFELSQAGKLRMDQAFNIALEIKKDLKQIFEKVEETGQLYAKDEIVDKLQFIAPTTDLIQSQNSLAKLSSLSKDLKNSSPYIFRGNIKDTDIKIELLFCKPNQLVSQKYLHAASETHLSEKVTDKSTMFDYLKGNSFDSENEIFEKLSFAYIHPENREGFDEWQLSKENKVPDLINYQDLKGPLHNHSTWSDGKNTLVQMSEYCQSQGWQYLGISDHSQSATYANGLQPERIIAQHKEIDTLNTNFKSKFRIFKGIESDILADGSLDYEKEMLKMFDYIVASVHSGLGMDIDKATQRLIKAIENPYTTILGHPTGRLLLKRKGYPVDFHKVIDACAANNVAIEINANPWRLDISWKYVKLALDKGVKMAICPDAHENEGFLDMQFGIWMGRKGFLTADMCVNCMDTEALYNYFKAKK